ncbi:GntR family transcriptional regulator [bacterium]|nr:GntR family transcriptional regulator [bacterium]
MALLYRNLREQIVEQLRRDVLSGELPAGEPLREESLAKRFGVSRGPIRDALLQLSQEGLLVTLPNRGSKVGPGPSTVIQPLVVSIRRQIEAFALRQIFASLTAEDLSAIATILEAFHTSAIKGDLASTVEQDMAFHRWFVERVGDPDLTAMWLNTILRMRLRYTRHASLLDSYDEHVAVLEALRRHDLEAAVALLEANIL